MLRHDAAAALGSMQGMPGTGWVFGSQPGAAGHIQSCLLSELMCVHACSAQQRGAEPMGTALQQRRLGNQHAGQGTTAVYTSAQTFTRAMPQLPSSPKASSRRPCPPFPVKCITEPLVGLAFSTTARLPSLGFTRPFAPQCRVSHAQRALRVV